MADLALCPFVMQMGFLSGAYIFDLWESFLVFGVYVLFASLVLFGGGKQLMGVVSLLQKAFAPAL